MKLAARFSRNADVPSFLSSVAQATEIALIYVGLGDKDQAMAWLEKAYTERFNPSVLLRPAFDPLRADPRFKSLVRRVGILSEHTEP